MDGAGPVRRRSVRPMPYNRPPPSQQSSKPGIFNRVKSFLFGSGSDRDAEKSAADYTLSSNTSANVSQAAFGPADPNDTLRNFFEQKGNAELSDMEVIGVLSLIRDAVSRNESVVDFSTMNQSLSQNLSHSMSRDYTNLHNSSQRRDQSDTQRGSRILDTPPRLSSTTARQSPWSVPSQNVPKRRSLASGPARVGYLRQSLIRIPSRRVVASPHQVREPLQKESLSESQQSGENDSPAASALLEILGQSVPGHPHSESQTFKPRRHTTRDSPKQAGEQDKPDIQPATFITQQPATRHAEDSDETPSRVEPEGTGTDTDEFMFEEPTNVGTLEKRLLSPAELSFVESTKSSFTF